MKRSSQPMTEAGSQRSSIAVSYIFTGPCSDLSERLARVYGWAIEALKNAESDHDDPYTIA